MKPGLNLRVGEIWLNSDVTGLCINQTFSGWNSGTPREAHWNHPGAVAEFQNRYEADERILDSLWLDSSSKK